MALGDLMASRFSPYSSNSFSPNHIANHHLDELPGQGDAELPLPPGDSSDDSSSAVAAAALVAVPGATTSMAYLPQSVVLLEPRHEAFESGPPGTSEGVSVSKWRPKERMKTVYGAVVVCLNINVDPPDVIKISPCARMECWIDPFSMAAPKALEVIGKALHAQYERWQPKARCKVSLDPTVEEVKKLCLGCRKNAKTERVLFHYNGHGVPKPTANGEIWVFNKSYTQYIPLPVSELDSWLKTPSIYVFDCSAAGLILQEWSSAGPSSSNKDCILLAACDAHETLPQSAEFPADVFTSCLTTPIKMALRWFCSRSLLRDSLSYALIDKIPGRQNDRKTLLGELNWIFTAVTDTIAWNVLNPDLFQRLFRQDLLVASLFRNFLLAERIMRSANCSPISCPPLPSTHQHHMWDAWDMAAEICLSKLPLLIDDPTAEFQPSPFFTEQLKAFEVWLDHGSENKKPPEQLPIVLQVLLSQSHRFRALILLGRFLDMGPWAVNLALSVGIFPYVLKLLQTTASDLRNILVFIWTKILALDKACQVDLVKDGGHAYFIRFLDSLEAYPEQRAMAAFVLTVIVDGHRKGQEACFQENLMHVCLRHLELSNPSDVQAEPLLLQWLCLCLGKLCEDFPEAQIIGLQSQAPAIYASLLTEPQPEVRAAAIFALGTLIDINSGQHNGGIEADEDDDDYDEKLKAELAILKTLLEVATDGSPLVRAEVVVALARFAFGHNKPLKSVAASYWKPQSKSMPGSSHSSVNSPLLRVGSNLSAVCRDGGASASTSIPGVSSGMMHGSPLSDNSSHNSDPGILLQENASNGVNAFAKAAETNDSLYSQCVLAMYVLAKDPSPRVCSLGQRTLSIIGIEQVVAKPSRIGSTAVRQGDSSPLPAGSSLVGLARSSSWFDMSAGPLPLTFRTPPVSPPKQAFLTGMRRVCSLEFRPHQQISPDSGLADPLLGTSGSSASSDRSLLPQSIIYKWSCGHFSKPLLNQSDDSEEVSATREDKERYALDRIAKCHHSRVTKLSSQIASWDTKFETGTRNVLLLPFAPIVVAADQSECIRVWNYDEAISINNFVNHDFPDKGISNLCLVNELDDTLLLVASSDGSIRIWKNFTIKDRQKLVTAFSSIQSHKPGVHSINAVVDWQQQSGYLYASGNIPSIMLWDLYKEQLVNAISSYSQSSISALSASQVHGGQFVSGYEDGSVRLFDIRAPEMLVFTARPHSPRVQRVVGIGFQPGLDQGKIVSASQAGDIQIIDNRRSTLPYLTFDAHRGSLTALAIHRHAPVIASGSAKQIVKIFSMDGEQLSIIRYYPTFMAQRIGSVSCLAFHPYRVQLAAGASDSIVSIYADETSPTS